ncbi:MAG: tetratricopeptide repeat protein [Anaerolineales bacterium]|nr:MAG: tetratricopeptide repeat protein [Anaerolineales bacterium]
MMIFENKLDEVLEKIVTRWGIPGLSIGIVDSGEIAYTRSLGVQSLETQVMVTSESIFCLQSIGKCFVSCAVMQLVERGKIQLDAPFVQYLPYFKMEDDRYPQITIRQILSHTSGMPDMDGFEYNDLVFHPEVDDGAAERYVRGLSSMKLVHAPGEKFLYSNIGYNVLGDLISKISGQAFEEYMKVNILSPAGMPDSTFLLADVDRQRVAVPHLRTPEMIINPTYPYHRGDAPASFLHSTVVDMCRWAITCLKRGIYQGQRILTPASYDVMWTPAAKRGNPPLKEDMGLGWNLGHFDGVQTVSHGGGGFGWTGQLILLPEKGRAAIILCNEESSAIGRTSGAVLRTMLEQEPQAGKVMWMVPISQALHAGGIQSAYACYDELKRSGGEEYVIDDYELIGLVYQLMGVGKIDLAIDVLNLNIHAFPESVDSYVCLADLHFRKGQHSRAKELLKKALSIDPGSPEAALLLEKVRQH